MRLFVCPVVVTVLSISVMFGQDTAFDPRVPIKKLSDQCKLGLYVFEGDLQLDGQKGDRPGRTIAAAHVRLAAAPGGKYRVEIRKPDGDEYQLISDGQKEWAFVPALKKYTEQESGAVGSQQQSDSRDDDADSFAGPGGINEERDLAESFSQELIPVLSRMYRDAAALEVVGVAETRYGGKRVSWPLIRSISEPDGSGGKDMIELTMDPNTLTVGKMVWTNLSKSEGVKMLLRTTVRFDSFQAGSAVDDAEFTFAPSKKVKLVDSVPIPGQTGSFLLNKPAPDFEAKTIEGDKVRLGDLRGKPVLLNFWASWCGPCRHELPNVEKVHKEFKDKGLIVLGVNDEGKPIARQYTQEANLSFTTLDDGSQKLHRLYRVRSIPSVFLIDKDGKIVRFFSGARDEATLRQALKAAGL